MACRSARYLHNMFVWLIIHPFAAHPPTGDAVSRYMTKAIEEQTIDPLPKRTRPKGARVTRLGCFTYIPKPASDETASGVLAKGGLSITLDVTDEDLQDFVQALSVLEGGLSRRWMELEA
ncbi:hypothetical protein RKD20_005660 [Streptomyces sp. SLBN-8D4]|jgi:hypothetical protein